MNRSSFLAATSNKQIVLAAAREQVSRAFRFERAAIDQ
jgi:hypothetical protein